MFLPWFRDAARRDDLGIADCAKCKASTPQLQRQSLGCGYEPPTNRVALNLWSPPDAYDGPPPTVCAGFTTALPEVMEAAFMRAHWKTGNLAAALGGEPATDELLAAIITLDYSFNAVEAFRMSEKGKS